MPQVDLYDNLAGFYDIMISWKSRLRREKPFFTKLFKEFKVKRILDTACGTGMHAIAFHDWGYHVTGADISSPMVEKSRENADGRDIRFIQAGFSDSDKVDGLFDAVTCLGNSLPHVLTDEALDASLSGMYDSLLPGGVLIIHSNNYDKILSKKERFMPVAQGRHDGTEYIFLRFFDFHETTLTFNVVSLTKSDKEWHSFPDSSIHRPLTKKMMEEHLTKARFINLRFFGGYPNQPFDEAESDNLIVVAEKPHTRVTRPLSEPSGAIDRISIREGCEPMVDLSEFAPHIRRGEMPIILRRKVAEMLVEAEKLLPAGLHMKVNIAYRSMQYQRDTYSRYYDELIAEHPEWPKSRLRREVNKFVAPPDGKRPPGHTTGGAVDLVLVDDEGREIDMMSSIRKDEDEQNLIQTYSRLITPKAAKSRQILIDAMTSVGFSNYPGEWWHYSYGESAWALRTGESCAIYGEAPESDITKRGDATVYDKSLKLWEG